MAEEFLSAAQRSKIRRLSRPKEPEHGDVAGELNIIPYLDIIMNIIVFVISTLSVVFLTTLDTSPPAGGGRKSTRSQSQALNLSVLIVGDGMSIKTSSGNIATGCGNIGAGVTVPKTNGKHDFSELTRCARELKKQNEKFAKEKQVTITANSDTEFQIVVSAMDALRMDEQGPLFPEVNFGVVR